MSKKYKHKFTLASPNAVYYAKFGYSIPYLSDLWYSTSHDWEVWKFIPGSKQVETWILLRTLTNILIHRNAWNYEIRKPKSAPSSWTVENKQPFKTYRIGSPEWMEYWKSNPSKQQDMIDHMKEINKYGT